MHKNQKPSFLYTNDKLTEKVIKETILLTIISKDIYLRVTPTKQVKDLCNKYLRHWEKLKKSDGKISHVHGLG